MKNPLLKRIPRELKNDFGKYLVIFLFLTLTIGFVSGYLVADGSMLAAYDESFETYNIEDGNFELTKEADKSLLESIEKEEHIDSLYHNYYVEEDTDSNADGKKDSTMRIFINREKVNKVCLMDGELPKKKSEIAIDRMYADNNKLKTGDDITIAGKKLKVTGLVALSDYSALFSDNGDMMFDAVKFGVAIMTEEGFDQFGEDHLHYNYAWKYDKAPKDDEQEKEWSDAFSKKLAEHVFASTGDVSSLTKFIPRYANQAIQFTGDDIGGDRSMVIVMLYILLVILAFVFAVTCGHTITREAAVIGTLRASGYTRGELLRHYITLPILVTIAGALIGNIIGYTWMKELCAAMYYGSYSLPTYVTRWNVDAFVLTTVIPVILMFVINVLMINSKLKLSPLQFLRRDLTKRKKKKAMKLPHFQFFTRFRLRIIFQNLSSYVTLFVGIAFANVLLLFGMMMTPLLSHYQDETLSHMFAKYQYILKTPIETDNEAAEKYCAGSLVTIVGENAKSEDITIYGIQKNSEYVKISLPENGVFISDSYAEKFRLSEGDKVTLKEKYSDKEYTFEVKGICEYPAALAVFMTKDNYVKTFDKDTDYYNGYFSDEKLKDLPKSAVLSTITKDELTKVSRQLDVSMGKMFYLINIFAVILFTLLIYLLTKLIIERNASSISMVKILGYRNGEISRLYLLATTWVVGISVILSLVFGTILLKYIYWVMLASMTGWLTMYIAPWIYPAAFAMGMAAYGFVALLQMRKIRQIPMDEALKNVE